MNSCKRGRLHKLNILFQATLQASSLEPIAQKRLLPHHHNYQDEEGMASKQKIPPSQLEGIF